MGVDRSAARTREDKTGEEEADIPPLAPAARRALDEAAERRRQAEAAQRPVEVNGRGGTEPVRYGDWEIKGLAVDF